MPLDKLNRCFGGEIQIPFYQQEMSYLSNVRMPGSVHSVR
jgi:hypothetical protein